MPRLHGRRVPLLVVASLLLLSAVAVEATWRVDVAAPRQGCVFDISENIRLDLAVTEPESPQLDYVFRNVWQQTLAQGELTLVGDATTLELPPPGCGYYEVELSQGGRQWVSGVVVTILDDDHYDPPAGSLFGLQSDDRRPDAWAAVAHVSPAWFRSNAGWPNFNPLEDLWLFDSFRADLELIRNAGFRTLVTVGYSAGWQTVKPTNVEGTRYERRGHTWPYRSNVAWHEAARRYWVELGPLTDHVELWNEVDYGFGCLPLSRYSQMLKVFGAWMFRLQPDARLVSGCSATWSGPAKTTSRRATCYLDLQNSHYVASGSDAEPSAQYDYGIEAPLLRMKDFQPYERWDWWFPLVCAEGSVGSFSSTPDGCLDAGAGMVKGFTQSMLNGLRYYIWFSLHGNSARFMMRHPYAGAPYLVPTPPYAAYATSRRLLERGIPLGNCSRDYRHRRYLFVEPDGTVLLVAWQRETEPVQLRVALKDRQGEIIHWDGHTETVNGRFARFTTSRQDVRFLRGVSQDFVGLAALDTLHRDWDYWRRWLPEYWERVGLAYRTGYYTGSPAHDLGRLHPDRAANIEAALAAVAAAALPSTRLPEILSAIELLQQQYVAMADALVTDMETEYTTKLFKQFVRLAEIMWQVERLHQALSLVAASAPGLPSPTPPPWGPPFARASRPQGSSGGAQGYEAYVDASLPIDQAELFAAQTRIAGLYADLINPDVLATRPRLRQFVRNYVEYYLEVTADVGCPRLLAFVHTLLHFAERLNSAEPETVTRVLLTTDWPDETYIVKALRVQAGETYDIQVNVHNFSDQDVTGQLQLTTGSPELVFVPSEVPFSAPGGGTVVSYQVQLHVNSADVSSNDLCFNGTLDPDGIPVMGETCNPYVVAAPQ